MARIPKMKEISLLAYMNIEFELRSPRDNNDDKQIFTYDQSLERIKAAGYERHARPSEVFDLIIVGSWGGLTRMQAKIYNDMYLDYGEWLSMAWQQKKDKILLYQDPENLKWDGRKYVIDGKLIYSDEKEFPLVKNISPSEWIDLRQLDSGLVQYLYSKPLAQLPAKMCIGSLYPSPKNILWPLCHFVSYDPMIYGFKYDLGASRGVASREKIP